MPALVRMPELTITEATLLARLLELAPVEVSMSRATISDEAAAELMATAQSLRTATLEAITTAERTDIDEHPARRAARAWPSAGIDGVEDAWGRAGLRMALDRRDAGLPDQLGDDEPGEPVEPDGDTFKPWVLQVYEVAVGTWRDLLTETGMPAEGADHLARAALARLAALDPPLTVEKIR